MDLGLKGKVAIITGTGSQKGFGKGIALTLAREGCDIVSADMDIEGAAQTAGEVEALGCKTLTVKVDVSKKDDVDGLVKQVIDEFGKIDIMVNNAGIASPMRPFVDTTVKDWNLNIDVNYKGTLYGTYAVLPHMMDKDAGIIINLSGGGAASHMTAGSGYGSSKAAVLRLTDTLARELKHENSSVLVFAVDPGFNRTAMTESLATSSEASKWWNHIPARLGEDDGTMRQR